jgi:hypothetical protein
MTVQQLIKLYALSIEEEHYYIEAHQDRVAYYSGLATAIIAGVAAGLFQSSEWYHYAALTIGPVMLCAISIIARAGTFRLYQRFLEAVTVRAKIEQELDLTRKSAEDNDSEERYWKSEPIIGNRHISSRQAFTTSEEFIKAHSEKGYHGVTLGLFKGLQWLSIAMLIGLLSLTVWSFIHKGTYL